MTPQTYAAAPTAATTGTPAANPAAATQVPATASVASYPPMQTGFPQQAYPGYPQFQTNPQVQAATAVTPGAQPTQVQQYPAQQQFQSAASGAPPGISNSSAATPGVASFQMPSQMGAAPPVPAK